MLHDSKRAGEGRALPGNETQTAARGAADALAFFYGLWAVASLGRAIYQYGFRHPEHFTPTHISTFVGVLYLFIIVGLRRRSPHAWWGTLALLAVELAGVLIVGTIDVVWRPFPYASVWSMYGAGYFFMPLVMPFVGIWWILRKETRAAYGIQGSQG